MAALALGKSQGIYCTISGFSWDPVILKNNKIRRCNKKNLEVQCVFLLSSDF
jgi:hypothetical protein